MNTIPPFQVNVAVKLNSYSFSCSVSAVLWMYRSRVYKCYFGTTDCTANGNQRVVHRAKTLQIFSKFYSYSLRR